MNLKFLRQWLQIIWDVTSSGLVNFTFQKRVFRSNYRSYNLIFYDKSKKVKLQSTLWRHIVGLHTTDPIFLNPLAPELFFLILAHPVYKMWVIQEPNKLALWNKLHFEEKKTESIEHV